jgi:hypothetical protein
VSASRPDSVVAIAGRRFDKAGAPPRFPLANEALVRKRLRELLVRLKVRTMVSSAACGTDLIALEIGAELGLRRIVFLPHVPEVFRTRSVIDRAPEWGPRFDRAIKEVRAARDLRILNAKEPDDGIYRATNVAVVAEVAAIAAASAGQLVPLAIVVWNGTARGATDVTEHFRQAASARDLPIETVSTL